MKSTVSFKNVSPGTYIQVALILATLIDKNLSAKEKKILPNIGLMFLPTKSHS